MRGKYQSDDYKHHENRHDNVFHLRSPIRFARSGLLTNRGERMTLPSISPRSIRVRKSSTILALSSEFPTLFA